MRTLRGLVMVSRTGGDPPCSDSTHLRVYIQNVPVYTGIHGDVLNVHTESVLSLHTGFSACHTTPHTETHTETETEKRQRKKTKRKNEKENEKKKKREEEKEKKETCKRRDKTREK